MNHFPFRLLLLAGMIVSVAVMLPYRLRSVTDEKLDRRREGWSMLIGLRVLAAAAILLTCGFVLAPSLVQWGYAPAPAWCRYLGAVLLLAGAAFMGWTMASLGRNLTDTVVTRRDHQLVTHGPYAWMRHPFYFAYALQWVGAALLASNWAIALSHLAVWSMLVLRSRTEERLLQERFGAAYREYRRRVGFFWPRRLPLGEA